jgi:hypothetical protein
MWLIVERSGFWRSVRLCSVPPCHYRNRLWYHTFFRVFLIYLYSSLLLVISPEFKSVSAVTSLYYVCFWDANCHRKWIPRIFWTAEFLDEYLAECTSMSVNSVLNVIPPALLYAVNEHAFFETACYMSCSFLQWNAEETTVTSCLNGLTVRAVLIVGTCKSI